LDLVGVVVKCVVYSDLVHIVNYTVNQKNNQNVFCDIFYKTGPVLTLHIVLSKFVVQKCKRFLPHLNNVSTLSSNF